MFQEGKVSIRGAGEPQKMADEMIERVYTSFHESNDHFWDNVREISKSPRLGKRTLVASAEFLEFGEKEPVAGELSATVLQGMVTRVGRENMGNLMPR